MRECLPGAPGVEEGASPEDTTPTGQEAILAGVEGNIASLILATKAEEARALTKGPEGFTALKEEEEEETLVVSEET